jgi:hypothetical protein
MHTEWETPDGLNDLERRFLAELVARWGIVDVWMRPNNPLVTSVDVSDRGVKGGLIVRTLRADFDGETLRCGSDPTYQIAGDLDPDDPDGYVIEGARSPEELAAAAAAWYQHQYLRPIDRLEWDTPPACKWVLVDVGRTIVVSGGSWSGPPDRVVRAHPPAPRVEEDR